MANHEERAYKTTDLVTLRAYKGTPEDRDLLLKLYEQTCTTWRMLVDVRFKLFALVPTVSLASLATIFSEGDSTKYFSPGLRFLFALLGLAATVGLLVYELRIHSYMTGPPESLSSPPLAPSLRFGLLPGPAHSRCPRPLLPPLISTPTRI